MLIFIILSLFRSHFKLGTVVRRVNNFIQRINPYPVDKICSFVILMDHAKILLGIYPLDNFIHSSHKRNVISVSLSVFQWMSAPTAIVTPGALWENVTVKTDTKETGSRAGRVSDFLR